MMPSHLPMLITQLRMRTARDWDGRRRRREGERAKESVGICLALYPKCGELQCDISQLEQESWPARCQLQVKLQLYGAAVAEGGTQNSPKTHDLMKNDVFVIRGKDLAPFIQLGAAENVHISILIDHLIDLLFV